MSQLKVDTITNEAGTGPPEFPEGAKVGGDEVVNAGNFLDYAYPVGSFYVQYPDADSNTEATAFPTANRPASLFGGTWAAQWEESGDGSEVFFTTSTNDTNRTDGLQTDRMQQITGDVNINSTSVYKDGVFTTAAKTSKSGFLLWSDGNSSARLVFDANRVARTGTTTRPRNRRIRVWKRTS
jgi:hypothetical protein